MKLDEILTKRELRDIKHFNYDIKADVGSRSEAQTKVIHEILLISCGRQKTCDGYCYINVFGIDYHNKIYLLGTPDHLQICGNESERINVESLQ